MAMLALGVICFTGCASPLFRPGNKNVAWRKARCLDGKEWGHSPRWIAGIYRNIKGKSWNRPAVCELQLKDRTKIFHDGCSGQTPIPIPPRGQTWGKIMHQACVIHDHCYHHNPITYGKSRKTCDREFRANMLKLCELRYGTRKMQRWRRKCRRAAKIMAFAVSIASKKHYNYANYRADYKSLYPKGGAPKAPEKKAKQAQ